MPLVATEITEEIHRALRVEAAERHLSLKALLQEILVQYANKESKAHA